jgi:hypothetical protein
MRRRSYEVAYTASHRRLSAIVRASVRAQATTAPDASSPSSEPTALKNHLVKWGRALAAANRADALGRYFASDPTPRVESPAGAATFEVATAGISAAHGQLAAITGDWNANAQVHLCGSSVTQAHVTATSDLWCRTGSSQATGGGGGPAPPRATVSSDLHASRIHRYEDRADAGGQVRIHTRASR